MWIEILLLLILYELSRIDNKIAKQSDAEIEAEIDARHPEAD